VTTVVRVTRAQIAAARLAIRRREQRGQPISDALRAIANAKRSA
jgi:hypothetical protein